MTANLTPQERKRGLFHATVYDAKVEMQGVFVLPTEWRLRGVLSGRPLWNESFIALSTTSLTGLRSEDQITVDGTETPWHRGIRRPRVGLQRRVADPGKCAGGSRREQRVVPGDNQLRGTGAFNLLYAGKQLDVAQRSPWRTPSFGVASFPKTPA